MSYRSLVCLALLLSSPAAAQPLTGSVVDGAGQPLEGVRVRVSRLGAGNAPISSDRYVTSDARGRFSAEVPQGAAAVLIGIGRVGYMNISGILDLGRGRDLGAVQMDPVPAIDNENYAWWKPYWPKDDPSDVGCNACHGEQADQWRESEMARSARNPRVLSYYLGTDVDGNPAGDGYIPENPTAAGPCANCHAPAAAVNTPGQVRLDEIEGVAQEGVFCDTCHKIRDVIVDNGPGVGGSIQYLRPSAWTGLFAFGPFEDVGGPMRSSYSELIQTSRICAGCHEWTNEHGVPVMTTYSEWSEVSGADPDALQCQDCHMKKKFGADYAGETNELVYIVNDPHVRQMHGVQREKSTVHPHTFHGGREYAAEAAALQLGAEQDPATGELVVTVDVQNVNAGHALPTGMPFRHAILVVDADLDGDAMAQRGGPSVPAYGGEGDDEADLAGRPGKGYARVLGDDDGNLNVPFWRATTVVEDTRIPGADADRVVLRFAMPEADGQANVTARLIYRRTWRAMNLEKKWGEADILMATASGTVALSAELPEPPVDAPEVPVGGAAPSADTDAESPASDGCDCRVGDSSPAGALWMLPLLVLGLRRRR